MWQVLEHRNLRRRVARLPIEVLKRYEKWKDIAQLAGPPGIRRIRGFGDEALRGKWRGYRSSRLGQQYRVIYRVDGDRLTVFVIEVTAHDYRKK